MADKTYRIKFGGEFACFSRPEFKVERVSYPVMTPSAARGAVEAIFWKPEIQWRIERIDVLSPIRETTLMRNELGTRQSDRQGPLLIEANRQQRMSRVLRDVEYVVHASMALVPHATEPLAKYMNQFERRVERGQFHHVPYLGTREFTAWFEPASDQDLPLDDLDLDIGPMLYDIAFVVDKTRRAMMFRKHSGNGSSDARGFAHPIFFDAKIEAGVLRVPPHLHAEKTRLEER